MKPASPAEKKSRIRRRAIEFIIEVVIAVTLVAGIALYAIYGPKQSLIDGKWIAFAANTAFVIGYALKFTRPLWRKPKLWAVFCGLLLMHGMVGWSVISKAERIPLVWYVPADMFEIWAALIVVRWAFTDDEVNSAASPRA